MAVQKQTPMLQLIPPSIKDRAKNLILVSSEAWPCPCFSLNSISILWKEGGWILWCMHSCSNLLPRWAITHSDFHPISSFNSSFSPRIHFCVIHSQGTAILLLPKPSRFQLYIARSAATETTWGGIHRWGGAGGSVNTQYGWAAVKGEEWGLRLELTQTLQFGVDHLALFWTNPTGKNRYGLPSQLQQGNYSTTVEKRTSSRPFMISVLEENFSYR